ncbi:hypothetical protein PANT_10c00030 [Moesziomyces antarcticus T-34]|uniref:Uncharacterized protein n=1 Tax=Pseudozyma antarctica (strain T-34) TaxID=1151754 RepID=M9LPQ9_PSEA3|nr:hypothetical protein PANT_10c00030 [Moesziomyces antarcticus T-34]
MDPASSSSLPSSAPCTPRSQLTSDSSQTSQSMSDARSSSSRKRAPQPARSRLSRPFRSPVKKDNPAEPSSPAPTASTSKTTLPCNQSQESSRSIASSSVAIRKQRQALEARLLLLQQANKCLREDLLSTLPKEIARWREAGQLAAQDLWKITGADGGDWSSLAGASTREDHALEPSPPPSPNALKRKARDSPEPSNPLLLRKNRIGSPGAEEQAAALRTLADETGSAQGIDSQGADSEISLPDLSELLRRSQSAIGARTGTRQHASPLGESDRTWSAPAASSASGALPERGSGMESKWNIGTMLDMLGADKSTLGWNVEEEQFADSHNAS